ncbi:MAG: hypothetical protein IJV35_07300 [Neisseriaceae bacterium]|nr:hypothetical protein [Neisseriaceae bacterium]
MNNFIRTLKKIYLYLLLFSIAVWLVEMILPPRRFILPVGAISFALLSICSRALCFHLAKRYGINIQGQHPVFEWLELKKGNEEWGVATMIFGMSCMITAIFFIVLYWFVPRIE